MCRDTIEALIRKGIPTVFYITGGGSGAIYELLRYGGASSFFLEAQVPYDNQCVTELLGGYKPDKFCAQSTASMLATCAYKRATTLTGTHSVIGVGSTAKLQKIGTERDGREHILYIAIHSKNRTLTSQLRFCNMVRDRREEEETAMGMIVKEYCYFLGIPCFTPSLYQSEQPLVEDVTSPWHMTPHVQPFDMGAITYNPLTTKNPVIFPGSFDPVHSGHIKMAEHAYKITNKAVWFEISLTNCSKPPIDWVSLVKRCGYFDAHKDNPAFAGLIFTDAPLFMHKARLFYEPIFITGHDTVLRIDNPRYYSSNIAHCDSINDLIQQRVQFLVFDRKGSMNVPFRHLGMETLCTNVIEYFDAGENSTDLRGGT